MTPVLAHVPGVLAQLDEIPARAAGLDVGFSGQHFRISPFLHFRRRSARVWRAERHLGAAVDHGESSHRDVLSWAAGAGGHQDGNLSRHRGEHVARAQQQLHSFISGLLAEGAKTGGLKDDVAPGELASYCLHALTAAGSLPSKAAVRRLVTVTMAGLRPPR